MKMIFAVASVLGFALNTLAVPSQGHKSVNAMNSIWGIKGGGLNLAFSPGQARFSGGDIIRALGLNQFIGNLYLQPVTLASEINQGQRASPLKILARTLTLSCRETWPGVSWPEALCACVPYQGRLVVSVEQ
jgi:hypothetical protein